MPYGKPKPPKPPKGETNPERAVYLAQSVQHEYVLENEQRSDCWCGDCWGVPGDTECTVCDGSGFIV